MDDLSNEISDKIFLKDLKNEFMINVISGIEQLKNYLDEENYKEMRKIAHDLKGVSSIFGYDKGSEMSENLQDAIDRNDKKSVNSLALEVIDYYKKNVIPEKIEED